MPKQSNEKRQTFLCTILSQPCFDKLVKFYQLFVVKFQVVFGRYPVFGVCPFTISKAQNVLISNIYTAE